MKLRVATAEGERLQAALNVLYSVLPEDQRAARSAEFQRDSTAEGREVMFAECDDQILGATLLVLSTDDAGLVFPPVIAGGPIVIGELEREAIEDALLQRVVQRLDSANTWIGQALINLEQHTEQAALLRNGFHHLTDLKFYSWATATFPSLPIAMPDAGKQSPPLMLNSTHYRPSRNRLRFATVVEQTYRGTLDCPELNGVRTARQALEHHAAAGEFQPEMWRLYQFENADMGVLLLVDRPEQQAWEIVYLGVIESARRRGFARIMLCDAQRQAAAVGREQLILAVDIRNDPAIRLYESCGFRESATRAAFIRLRDRNRQHVLHSPATS